MGINLKEVIRNTTAEEWEERYDQLFSDDTTIICELLQVNRRLERQNVALGVLATGMVLLTIRNSWKRKGK